MKKLIMVLLVVSLSVQMVYAAYTSYGTFKVKNDPVTFTTTGTMLGTVKTSTSANF